MTVTRRDVLEALAALSDATAGRTTTVGRVAAALGTDEPTVRRHLDGLRACELALRRPDGRVRVTVTGEEFLALDIDELAILDFRAE